MKKHLLFSPAKLLAIGLLLGTQCYSQTVVFNYTGVVQTYTVPVGVTSITVDVIGAQGGFGYNVANIGAGRGGQVQATVAVTPGEILNVYVGGQGGPGGTTVGGIAGYNGGGTGGGWPGGRSGGGGGGASDIRQGGNALANRIVIGSGGGGTGVNYSTGDRGGNGGGLTGTNGLTGTYLGGGATQSAGGSPNGVLGAGGNAPAGQTGGGGGGGYYGGGASAWEGGGGGSSYTAVVGVTLVTHTAGMRQGNGVVSITPVAALSATVTQSAFIQCFGQSTASLTATPAGGTSPYTYSWAPSGGTAATATGLAAGTYTVTITDAISSTTTQTFTITQPTLLDLTTTSTNILCNGNNTGSASGSATGGTSPYSYLWSNGGNTATISGLGAGVYTCTVTCSNGCTTSQSVTITSPSLLTSTSTSSSVLCNGDTATVTVAGAGGTSPYSGEGTFMQIAGTYTYTVTDANGCTSTTSVTITEPTAISTGITSVDVTCNGGADGSIDLTVSGGTGPYTFDWNSGTYTTEDLTGLSAGTYVGVLTDANGCTDGGTIIINEPSALVATLAIANDTVCSTDGSFTLTGESPAGGVFSGPGVAAGSFDPATAGVGVHVIAYLYTDSAGCTASTTDSIYVDVCTGSQFTVHSSQFTVFPNPNNGTFTLQVASASDVTIYDAQGKLVLSQKVQANVQNTLNLSTAGMYMITVVTADGQRTSQRVMVTK